MHLLILLVIALVSLSLAVCWIKHEPTAKLSKDIPRVRDEGSTTFSLWTRLHFYTSCDAILDDAYYKYAKLGRSCIIPFMGLSEHVVLPEMSMKWLGRQTSDSINPWAAAVEVLKARYTAPFEECIGAPWQGLLVKTRMNNVLSELAATMESELRTAFDTQMEPATDDWSTILVHDRSKRLVAQLSSSFSVGYPLCHDSEDLQDAVAFGELMTTCAGILAHIPGFLQPLLGPLVCLRIRWLERRTSRKLKPIIEQRLARLEDQEILDQEDRLQMMLRYARDKVPQELNVHDITGRLINANFGAMHQTSIAVTNTILNIASSDAEFDTVATLRRECTAVMAKNGTWTRQAVAQMVSTDSVIKETLRLHSFSSHVPRRVTAKEGVTTPDGVHLPYGTTISVLQRAPNMDPAHFPDPTKYDPFRFSRRKQSEHAGPSLIDISDTDRSFGLGKHACPGRFLVDFEIKMIIAYLLLNYDVKLAEEHRGSRPPPQRMLGASFPPSYAKIDIRRRVES